MIKSLIKSFLTIIFILLILSSILFSIYYFSPEVNPGEIGVVYKIYGKNRGFTGRILTPGKYYYFLTGLIPGIHEVYKISIKPKFISTIINLYDGTKVKLTYGYDLNKNFIKNFVNNTDKKDIEKILNVYIKSDIENLFLNLPNYKFISPKLIVDISSKLMSKVNKELSFFGLKLVKLSILDIKLPPQKLAIIKKLKENQIALEKLKIETEKKIKEEKIKNELKLEKLQYLMKKAELEKKITEKKLETQNLIWENQKKRLKEEVEILSKPGGENAVKLETIRMIVNSLKNEEKIKDATQIMDKILK